MSVNFKKAWKRAASLYWSRWKNEYELAKVDRARRVSSDAEACRLRGENAFLTKEVKNLRMTLDQVKVERDRCSKDALALGDQVKGAKELIDSLDDALSRSRDERRQLRARLVECRPWVGVCPFPNQPGFGEMIAIRDLADDTLGEVKP
jgi:septal ring factor EnvC (AmiA/AmiB activator)